MSVFLVTSVVAFGVWIVVGDESGTAVHGHGNAAVVDGSQDQSVAQQIPVATEPLRESERFVTVGIPQGAYTPASQNGANDDYRCFLVDPRLDSDAFITGVQFLPGNAEIVHHAILYRAPVDQLAAARSLDAGEDGQGWSCFGGPGLDGDDQARVAALDSAPWLAGWAPGGAERTYAPGLGVHVDADSQVIMQVHYNLNGGSGSDSTRVRLRVVPGELPLTPLETMLLPAPVELPCSDGQAGRLCHRSNAVLDVLHRFGENTGRTVAGLQLLCGGDPGAPRAGAMQSCDRRIDEPATIFAAAGHMHLLGKTIRIELNPGTAQARTMLDIPVWDFDNQGARPLAEPVQVGPGDTVRVTCTHDAGLRDLLPAFEGEPDRYVVWGEGTTDEMCLGILVYARR